ncbi:hypothetical protein A2U01_0069652, partial [Trifolium medium]|nr:hypothetical protein [Trifolium medium]
FGQWGAIASWWFWAEVSFHLLHSRA